MKKTILTLSVMAAMTLFACKKSSDASQVTLTPSATQVAAGEQVSVTLSGNVNASNWKVSPASTAAKAYGLTTSKVNYFTFSQAGVYTISVQARNISYDSTNQSLEYCWNKSSASHGRCTPGVDSASVAVTVTGK